MKLQLITIKTIIIRVNSIDYKYVKPKYLSPVNQLQLIEAKVKGSCMVWNIQGEQITYNQIKQYLYLGGVFDKG